MQIPYHHPAWIEVDLVQFKKNILAIKAHIGKARLCLPVKANAYGHGIVPMAQAAQKYGVDYLAVSCLQEGLLLRKAQISIPILVLGAIHEDQIADLIEHDLEFTISSKFKAELVYQKMKVLNKECKIHVEVETGMQRTGLRCESAEKLIEYINQLNGFQIIGIYSHMASADIKDHPFAHLQILEFKNFIAKIRDKIHYPFIAHIANSGGVCYFIDSLFDMVRPGLLAFGYFDKQESGPLNQVAPFFSLKAKISYFKVVAAGKGISYSHTYVTEKETRVITIPVGYGDGYRRMLSNKSDILHRGKRYKISGNICMDQFMVDIQNNEAFIGDEIVLIGEQGEEVITVQQIAKLCETITYEILCAFTERIPRVYLN